MKFPKQINVLGTIYKIKLANVIAETQAVGEYCRDTKTIRIDKNLPKAEMLKTFIHELKHAQQAECGLHQCLGIDVCEIDAEMTARVFTEIFDLKFKKG